MAFQLRNLLAPRHWQMVSTLTPAPQLSTSSAAHARPNTRRPRHATWERKKLLHLSKPVYPDPHPDTALLWQDCPRLEEDLRRLEERNTANAFERLYAEEMCGFLQTSRVIALFHFNETLYHPKHKAWQNCRRAGLELKEYNHRVARAAMAGTKWEPLMHFWDTCVEFRNPYVGFGRDPDLNKVLQLDRKIPIGLLLGAVVDGRMLTKQQLQELAKMPPIEVARAELCAILQMPVQNTVGLLGRSQQQLSQNLEQYVKDQSQNDN